MGYSLWAMAAVSLTNSDEGNLHMNLKKFGMALVAVLALGAVMANTAFGAATTTDVQWYLNGSSTALSGSQAATSGLVGTGTLETEVGETPLTLNSTGLECVGCTIFNEGSSAKGAGKLKFTGVTVATPTGCEVSGGAVETSALTVDADYMIETKNYVRFAPVGTSFATVTLKAKTGKTCAISGPYIVKGAVFVKSQKATGEGATKQLVNSSGPINAEAGGELKFGSKNATLTGEAFFEAGGNSFLTK